MDGPVRVAALASLLALTLLAGCGSPTAPPEEGGKGASLKSVLAKLEGLDAPERRKKLIELARDEGGVVSVYGSTNYESSGPLLEHFEEKTGIKTKYYRASSSDVLQRLLQEWKAGRALTDTVMLNGTDMVVLDEKKLLEPLDTPVTKQIKPSVVYENWVGFYVNAFAASWNTKGISKAKAPGSWEEVLSDYPGQIAMEVGDWDWFATLVQDYFMAEKGMTEDEAVGLFRKAARNAGSIVDGHTLMAEMLAAGEYDMGVSLYTVNTQQLQNDGAPVEWQPGVEPLVQRPNGLGVHRHAEHPASALLYLEFMLTDGQKMLPELERDPVNVNVKGGLPAHYKTIPVSVETMRDGRAKWESLYEKVIAEAGKKPVSE
ncbi:MAG: ABC transporter substrate-binding protein [Micromonosporaceae bacterium]